MLALCLYELRSRVRLIYRLNKYLSLKEVHMPRKSLVTDRERTIIATVYNENREAKAEAIRQDASKLCGRDLGLSTVQRELAKLRKVHPRGSTDPLDNQWSLASLKEYPVDSNAIPLLLYIQATFEANIPEQVKRFVKLAGRRLPFLTNRYAIWISRLMNIVQIEPDSLRKQTIWTPSSSTKENLNKWPEWVDDLVNVSMWYSNYEIGCELTGLKPIITANIDAPTLNQIKMNILLYRKYVLKKELTKFSEKPEVIEKLKSASARDLIPKGGKYARPHN